MYGPNEEKLKAMLAQDGATQECGASIGGMLGRSVTDKPCRPSLMERVNSQRFRAQEMIHQHGQLAELQFLLEKNPEVARILDLMDCLKG